MFWGIVQRAIFMELLRVFLLASLALTGILLMGGIFEEATKNGLTPGQILAVIPLLIPNTLPYTLPTTTLFATCVIYGRLAHDNEILAIRAAGVNMLAVVWPAVVLGGLASAGTFYLSMDLIPSTQRMLRESVFSDIEEWLYIILKSEGHFRHPRVNYEIYVRRVEGRTLIDVEFRRREANSEKYDIIAWAREAQLHVDLANHQLEVCMHHCFAVSTNGEIHDFSENDINMKVELPDMKQTYNHPRQLIWKQLFEREAEVRRQQKEVQDHIDALLAANPSASGPAAETIRHLKENLQHQNLELANVISEYHMRPSLALGCLCFVLVGCPIGIWFSKSDYLSAFVTCFMPIVVMYYPLVLCGINMGKSGTVHPAASIWVANILMSVTALFLLRKLIRH